MTAPREDAGDSSPLAPPVGGSNEPQDARLAEVLERSNLLLGALRLSDSPSESPAGTSPAVNTTLLRRRRRPEEAEEAKENSELRERTMPTTRTTSTSTLSEAVPDNPGTPSSPNDPNPRNGSETTGPFYVDLIDEDDQQQRRPMRRRRRRSRERSDDIMAAAAQESNAADGGDTTTATTGMSATELLAPRVSERHVSTFYQNIMAQVYLLEEQEGARPRYNNNNNNNNNNGPNRRMNTRVARGA